MKSLLLIEDEQSFADILLRRLSHYGYKCIHGISNEQGLALAEQHSPTHLILDLKVGNQNSLIILPQLRAKLPKSRIILLTGYASIATAVEAIKAGADDYLSKPVDTKTLLTMLDGDNKENPENKNNETNIMSPSRLEWEHIQQVLKSNLGNISVTARQLGMHRRTLQRKLLKKPTSA
ncbi:response regulator transcription factor [Paraglaciecola arctica]|uniref:Photosynthetic apparatus regulatory protein regA n=1 Tax=Paraglaciecola arctica BSs20135 TaxID=493475 RepID=K6YGA0_9ALTE|nr:response regulator [Paraglaciecola arctica]GAC17192.1 photosynthetic apparatus regulatory protein regA [Paraglaciecola arctica BSs20135]